MTNTDHTIECYFQHWLSSAGRRGLAECDMRIGYYAALGEPPPTREVILAPCPCGETASPGDVNARQPLRSMLEQRPKSSEPGGSHQVSGDICENLSITMAKYFVILHDQQGGAVAMTCDEYGFQLSLFETYEEADDAGSSNIMGKACGYDVHELGGGCDAH